MTYYTKWRKRVNGLLIFVPAICLMTVSCAAADSAAPQGGAAKLVLKKGDRVVVIGDSITTQKIYSRFIEDYLTMCTPQLDLWLMQLGRPGETAGGFLGRMEADLLAFKPNVITTCYGMNDGGGRTYEEKIGDAYYQNMKTLVTRAKAAGVITVVGGPGMVEVGPVGWNNNTPVEAYNNNLSHLSGMARKVAMERGMVFANVHGKMMGGIASAKAALGDKYRPMYGNLHPNPCGHLVMAYAFLKGMGLDGNIGTITLNMNGEAEVTEGHKVLSSKAGEAEIESQRYPFCFFDTRDIVPFVPFNQDLNRLTLVVKNLKSDKAKIVWDEKSKSFTREQLANGINLAAEFLDNPFSKAFARVDGVVARKQQYETDMFESIFPSLSAVQKNFGMDAEATAAFKTLRERALAKHESLRKEVLAARLPVKHKLTAMPE